MTILSFLMSPEGKSSIKQTRSGVWMSPNLQAILNPAIKQRVKTQRVAQGLPAVAAPSIFNAFGLLS